MHRLCLSGSCLSLQCFLCGGAGGPSAAAAGARAGAWAAAWDGSQRGQTEKRPRPRHLTAPSGASSAGEDGPGSGRLVREGGGPSDCPPTCWASNSPSCLTSTRSPRYVTNEKRFRGFSLITLLHWWPCFFNVFMFLCFYSYEWWPWLNMGGWLKSILYLGVEVTPSCEHG